MEGIFKTEVEWEVDLDPDAEPTADLLSASKTLTCGFCEDTLINKEELLAHALSEHDIGAEVFMGVDFSNPSAVREAFLRTANLRREFVSLGDVERCPKCSLLFASSSLLATHRCSADPESNPDPLGLIKPRDPLSVAQVDDEAAKAEWKRKRNLNISVALNSSATPLLIQRIVKPLAKPQLNLTVGNIIEMSLVETITQAGLKVSSPGRPADFDEESAVSIVHQLCMYPQKKLSMQLRELPPKVCMQLLYLLRSRRIRVSGSDTAAAHFAPSQIARNLLHVAKHKQPMNRLRTILPAPPANGSQLTLMESLLKKANEVQQVPSSSLKRIGPVMPLMPSMPFRFIKAKEPSLLNMAPFKTNKAVPEPPPRKLSREANYVCDSCSRTFESDYQFIKHMQWQSFDQKAPKPLFCRFCPSQSRYFSFCEKGFKTHVSTQHKIPDDYSGTLSLNGYILTIYNCGHCQKKKRKTFPSQVLYRRHLSTCCRKEVCTLCPAYFKGNPVAKKDTKKKWRVKQKRKSTENPSVTKRKKKNHLAPVECFLVKQEVAMSEVLANQGSSCENREDASEKNVETEIPCFEEIIIKEERLEIDEGVQYQCVACELATSSASILRNHFTSSHAELIEEFQMSVSRCGSVSVRWACPLCGRIFCEQAAFLGHLSQHNISKDDVLTRTSDLRHVPTLRAILVDLKSSKFKCK